MTLNDYDYDLSLLQVNTKNASNEGTLLQEAVYDGKTDFVRILLESGFVCIYYLRQELL